MDRISMCDISRRSELKSLSQDFDINKTFLADVGEVIFIE